MGLTKLIHAAIHMKEDENMVLRHKLAAAKKLLRDLNTCEVCTNQDMPYEAGPCHGCISDGVAKHYKFDETLLGGDHQ